MTSGTENRVRNRHLTLRLSDEERAAIDVAADAAGLTPGSYVRQIVLGAPTPDQGRRRPVERAELARLLGEVGKIGSNLNQLARAANSGNSVGSRDLSAALGGLQKVRSALLKTLGRDP